MPDDPLHHVAGRQSAGITIAAVLPFFLLTAVLGLLSDGVYHDDDLTHFLIARWARWFPEYLLHIWGRPGLTVPLAGVAWIGDASVGWHAVRLLSALVTAATAFLAARLAARLGIRHAWLVVPACYLQPLNTVLGATTLTENYTAFYLIAAALMLQTGRAMLASFVFSAVLVTRHEAMALLPIWGIAVLACEAAAKRRIAALAAAISAPLLHNILFRLVLGEWPVGILLQPQGSHEYPATGVLGYVPPALEAVPPALAGLAIVGAVVLARQGRLLIPALAGVYFMTHVAIKALGVYASGGYGRFMVAIAPFLAVLAVAGLAEFVQQTRRRPASSWGWLVMGSVWLVGLAALEIERAAGRIALRDSRVIWLIRGVAAGAMLLSIAAAAREGRSVVPRLTLAALTVVCVVQCVMLIRPLRLRDEQRQIQEVAAWLREQGLDDQPLFATNPWVPYFQDLVEFPRAYKGPALLASMPVGTVFLWDSTYSPSDFHRLPLAAVDRNPAYQLLREFPARGPRQQEVRAFRKIAVTPPPQEEDRPYPPDLMGRRRPVEGVYYLRPGRR